MSEMMGAAPAQEDYFAAEYGTDAYVPDLSVMPGVAGLEQAAAEAPVTDVGQESAEALMPALEPWGGRLAMTPFVEVKLPVTDMTATEKLMPGMLGGAMQFARMMQEGIWATVLQTELPPPTETVRIPISMN